MRAVEISQKTHLIRHWFKWYRVQRGGTDWQPLKIEKRPAPVSVSQIARNLQKAYPGNSKLPPILDEVLADRQVKKNLPKRKA